MVKETWVIVANSSQARILKADKGNTLVDIKTLEHPESRLHERMQGDGWLVAGENPAVEQTEPAELTVPSKKQEALHFAKEISDYLNQACHNGHIHRLYLVASPHFLGLLRQNINEATKRFVGKEIPKDATALTNEKIRDYLPPVM
ncbi:host attachment protein [Simkania negevensis]|uniref:Host attachment protein n=1 Tax=Simkania negevensis TaxID=83561 RepID=A0ABS3ARJ3_9BACT|nr:host attachment protein [Simkania negevensis]